MSLIPGYVRGNEKRLDLSHMYQRYGKRFFDLLFTLPALIILVPLIVLIALLVRIKLGTPILFRQIRPGRNGQLFTLYKFRTMTDDRDSTGALLPDEQRLPPFGRWLRGTSLDELPSLWNTLKGEMSLVGPRPLLVEYLERYTLEQRRRHAVRPGLTGWAQVNGRNAISWEEKFELDIWYVEHSSMWLDLKIIIHTIKQVLLKRNINYSGYATSPVFMGKNIEYDL